MKPLKITRPTTFIESPTLHSADNRDPVPPIRMDADVQRSRTRSLTETTCLTTMQETERLGRFRTNVLEILKSENTLIIDGKEENMELGVFLKLKGPNTIPAGSFTKDWVLWSRTIIGDIERLGELQLPVIAVEKELCNKRNVVLIGVSGSGKSRTCYDLCRGHRYCIYLDWTHHSDLEHLLEALVETKVPADFSITEDTKSFQRRVELITRRMLLCRLMALKVSIEHAKYLGEHFTPDNFFQLQQLSNMKRHCPFLKIAEQLYELSESDIVNETNRLFDWANAMDICIILDEVHELLKVLPGAFHSSIVVSVDPETGRYIEPRSFFSFMASFLRQEHLQSVWAGTHLRIADISRIFSARPGSNECPIVFTKFNFLTPRVIRKLLDEWVVISDTKLKIRISNELQGRPRLFVGFIDRLAWDMSSQASDECLVDIFDAYLYSVTFDLGNKFSLYNFWRGARNMDIREFVNNDTVVPPRVSVLSLLEDLLLTSYTIDTSKERQMYLYESLVSTALVMLGPVDNEPGLLCEPAVMKAGERFLSREMSRDSPVDTIINRYIVATADEGTRGRAVETLCVVRLRQGVLMRPEFRLYFSEVLNETIAAGWGGSPPLGVHDCRTGVANHWEKLRNSFLNPDATHVVLSQGRQGAADVVYGFFTFHIKTKWTDVRSNNLVIPDHLSRANESTIENTFRGDATMTARALAKPWCCVRFEFPTNKQMQELGVFELIERSDLKTTVTASINSEFTRLFFGDEFVNRVKQLTNM